MRISSLLTNPLNSFVSNYSIRLENVPASIKIMKSKSELETDDQIPCNRVNLVKNLTKI